MDCENVSEFFEEDIFSVLEAWENGSLSDNIETNNKFSEISSFEFQKSSNGNSPKKRKRRDVTADGSRDEYQVAEEQQKMTNHIAVERNRRKQMNDNLTVLRSFMPCFYVKRGDQASIVGGVVDYITELQQLLQSLQAKKQRKSYAEILSPRPVSSPTPSPRKPPLSPRTPQPTTSPYKPYGPHPAAAYLNSPSALPSPAEPSPTCDSSNNSSVKNELAASSKSAVAEVEVKFSGPNLVLKTVSRRVPGQAVRIVSALQELDLEILHVNITTFDERVINSFTIKIGIECQLSAEELAQQIQQTFS